MSEVKKGQRRKPFSEEWKRKLGDITRGKKFGPRSEETKRKISESHKARKLTILVGAANE